jgi:methionine biosynthesis protein MetW
MEISQKGVNDCVTRGLSVVQGDADVDLADYPDDGFDYVILSQTLQATRNPRLVLEQMLRIGKRAIVSFPNFGHWRIRWQLALRGHMPLTQNLSYAWYETPNIHLCSIRDFVSLVDLIDAHIVKAVAMDRNGAQMRVNAPWWAWNLFGEQAVFLLERGEGQVTPRR